MLLNKKVKHVCTFVNYLCENILVKMFSKSISQSNKAKKRFYCFILQKQPLNILPVEIKLCFITQKMQLHANVNMTVPMCYFSYIHFLNFLKSLGTLPFIDQREPCLTELVSDYFGT